MTQKERTLEFMKRVGGITRADAFNQLRIANLPARINELRRDGYTIESVSVPNSGEFGHHVRYELRESNGT